MNNILEGSYYNSNCPQDSSQGGWLMNNKSISPNDYRKKVGVEEEVELPSGVTFVLRRLSVYDFIKEGVKDLPNSFLTNLEGELKEKSKKVDKESLEFFDKIIRIIVKKGIVSPNIVITYTDKFDSENSLLFAELETKDQEAIFHYIVNGEKSKKV